MMNWAYKFTSPPSPGPTEIEVKKCKRELTHLSKEKWTDLIFTEEDLNTCLEERKWMKHENEWKSEGIFQTE